MNLRWTPLQRIQTNPAPHDSAVVYLEFTMESPVYWETVNKGQTLDLLLGLSIPLKTGPTSRSSLPHIVRVSFQTIWNCFCPSLRKTHCMQLWKILTLKSSVSGVVRLIPEASKLIKEASPVPYGIFFWCMLQNLFGVCIGQHIKFRYMNFISRGLLL